MFGRRPDGRRIGKIDPVVKITPYLMPMRCDAQVFLQHRIDWEKMTRYIGQQMQEKGQRLTHMQIIIAAYVRAVSENPEVNRFIMNKQYFARNNCSIAFTMLRSPQDAEQGEAVVSIRFDPYDTLYDVRDRMNAAVEANRGENAEPGFIDKLLNVLFAVPGLATVIVALVRLLDRYGIAPSALISELPFYVGMYITNNASIGLHHVNHHIYNFGDVSMFFGMGLVEKIAVVENGQTRMKRFLPLGITADERVCSGAHYARFFAAMEKYLDHPELLESPPESVRFDFGLEYSQPKVEKPAGDKSAAASV